jgi:hypothetical protein
MQDAGDMTAESLVIGGQVTRRKRVRTKSDHARVRLDKRFAIAKRVVELEAILRARIGVDANDVVTAAAITRCAETIALSELIRARVLRGDPTASVDDALRLSRSAEAMTRRLIDRHKAVPPSQSLAQYLGSQGNDNPSG